jgi:signal transduction histidine kinase
MPFYYTPYVILPLLSALVNTGLAAYAWRRRTLPSATPLFGIMIALAGWSLCYAANTSASGLWLKILCFHLATAFVVILVPSVIALGCEAAGLGHRLTRTHLLLVTLPVLITFFFSLSGIMPDLFRHGFHLVRNDGLLLLGYIDGPLFRFHIIYVLLANCAATILFTVGCLRSDPMKRIRFILLIAATILPMAVETFSLTPVQGFSTVTSTLLASGLLYSIAVFRHRLLELVPVGRGTLEDVEARLRESEQRYQLLVANMFEGVVLHQMILDSGGHHIDYRIEDVNNQYEKILGLRREDVVGMLSREAYGTAGVPYLEEYSRVVQQKKALRFDVYHAPLDRHFSISAAPWGDHGFATIFTDITEQKRAEEQLKNLNTSLEERVAREIMLRVTQERVLARQSRLAAMGDMIGAVAHQWRQPLSTVSVIVQNLSAAWKLDRLSREYVDQALELAQKQVDYMSSTIEEFLTFFRPDKRKELFCVNDKIIESLVFVEGQLHDQGIVITNGKGFNQQHFAVGYQNEFRQVILNILVNGRNAILDRLAREGGSSKVTGAIYVDISSSPDGTVIELTDNGCGIPPDIGSRIFESYFTTREKCGGTGIGLYMCRLIVEEGMGGTLSFTSEPGMTAFRITLPSPESE